MRLQKRLYEVLLRFSYYKSLMVGYFPGLIDWNTLEFRRDEQLQRTYRLASFCVHLSTVALVPWLYSRGAYHGSHMQKKPLLSLMAALTTASKVLAVMLLIRNIWLKRREAIDELHSYQALGNRYLAAYGGTPPPDATLADHLQRSMIWKFAANLANTLLTHYIIFLMDTNRNANLLTRLATSLWFNAYVNSSEMQLQYVLSAQLERFAYVNATLRLLRRQLASSGAPRELASRLRVLASMHLDCFRRTQRLFGYFQIPTATIMIKTFTTNVNLVYHSWLFTTDGIPVDHTSRTVGTLLTVVFYLDAALFVNLLQRVLDECHLTAVLVGGFLEYSELLQHRQVAPWLDLFTAHLRSGKLAFSVCGLFSLDMAKGVQCVLLVFVQVSVLMQFDIKNEMEMRQQESL